MHRERRPAGVRQTVTARDLVQALWFGDGPAARTGRVALAPLGFAFSGIARLRGRLYDAGLAHSTEPMLPAIAVGNLTVGGTGKTPIAAELVRRLLAAGARPAVVLRGYGDDEPAVHRTLNPEAIVVADPDRLAGVAKGAAEGADVAVLDDAFQHRRIRRQADVVLVSADQWRDGARLGLPAGPWREPLEALRRAALVVVTRKAAGDERVHAVLRAVGRAAPGRPLAVVRLEPAALRSPWPEQAPAALSMVAGRRVLAATAIGDPAAFLRQLDRLGASVVSRTWPDHHAFSDADVSELVRAAAEADLVLCTLKDAVKLAPRWPRAGPGLWYVSQAVTFERGESQLQDLLDRLIASRSLHTPHAG